MRRFEPYYVSPRTAWLLIVAGGVNAIVASAFVVITGVVDTLWQPVVAFLVGALLTYVQHRLSEAAAGRRLR